VTFFDTDFIIKNPLTLESNTELYERGTSYAGQYG